jgi:hypothetical protein
MFFFLLLLVPTLLASQYGTIREAANLLVPRGSIVLDANTLTIDRGAKSTGTPFGEIKLQPRTIYRCALSRIFMHPWQNFLIMQ